MATRRLLFVGGGSYVYGLERVVLRLVRGLANRGYDIFCTVNGWNNGEYKRELTQIGVPYQEIHLGWYYFRKPSWSLESIRHAPAALNDYRRLLNRFRPDLVFHSSYRSLCLLGMMLGPQNVMIVQDYWHRGWENRLVRLFDHKVRAYVAPSNDVRTSLIAGGFAPSKVERVYNSADFGSSVRSLAAPAGEVPVVGLVGQVSDRKGHHIAIEALARLRARNPELAFRLKIFGTGSERYVESVKRLTRARGLEELVDWCGFKSIRDEIYREIDFCIVPTTDAEPFGLVAIEPAIYGKPVIASECGGLKEIIKDGETGFLVPPSDPVALADRLLRLMSDRDLVRNLGQRAYTDYKARFNDREFVDQYCGMIRTLIGPP